MEYTLQHCCDKVMDGKMALYRECCFPDCTKSWWNQVTVEGFMGSDRPDPPWILPYLFVYCAYVRAWLTFEATHYQNIKTEVRLYSEDISFAPILTLKHYEPILLKSVAIVRPVLYCKTWRVNYANSEPS